MYDVPSCAQKLEEESVGYSFLDCTNTRLVESQHGLKKKKNRLEYVYALRCYEMHFWKITNDAVQRLERNAALRNCTEKETR